MKYLFLFFLSISTLCYGSPTSELFDVYIQSNASSIHNNALKEAFYRVINALTPGENDPENPVIKEIDPTKVAHTVKRINKGKQSGFLVSFNKTELFKIMYDAGQQPWINNRPKLLTFVRLNTSGWEEPVVKQDHPELFKTLEKAAAEKGLELVYCKVCDRLTGLTENDLSGPPVRVLHKKAAFDHPEATILITLSVMNKSQMVEYTQIHYKDETDYLPGSEVQPNDNIGRHSMAQASMFLFKQGEEKKIKPTPVYVNVSNILSPDAYNKTTKYLEHIPGVARASVNSVTEDAVLYTLDITIPQQLLDKRLAQKFTSLPSDPKEGIMTYRFKI